MADIRVERKTGSKAWLWILLALVVLAVALYLLYQGGYIGAAALGDDAANVPPAPISRLPLAATSLLQEVFHGQA